MVDLVAWFRAVLDDDEAAARKCLSTNVQASMLAGQDPPPWVYRPDGRVVSDDRDQIPRASTWPAEGAHIALHDPRQVLADVAAKRAILDAYLPEDGDPHPGLPCINYEGQNPEHYSEWDTCSRHIKANETLIRQDFVIRLLASAYRHRPGWRDSWGA